MQTNGISAYYQAMGMWVATFVDYDGAPDARDIIGTGTSERAAIADLMQQRDEREES